MAEIKRPIYKSAADVVFADGGGNTYAVTTLVSGSFTFEITPAYSNAAIMVQDGGLSLVHDSVRELSGPGTLKARFVFTDPLNVTDRTLVSLLKALQVNSYAGTGFSAWANATVMPGGTQLCVQLQATLSRATSASTGQTGLFVVWLTELGEITIENDAYVVSPTFQFATTPSWS